MESRASRKSLQSFPQDLAFTQDPKDPLRKLIDVQGRQLSVASEFIGAQLENLFLGTADPNEPSSLYTSGAVVPLDTALSGRFVADLQDLATMEVTGFDLIDAIGVSGVTSTLRGIAYTQDPEGSGVLYISTLGSHTVYQYDWKRLNTLKDSFLFAVEKQDFLEKGEDEYLAIQRDGQTAFAELRHVPRGSVKLIDVKNLRAPWDPANSDGLEVPQNEITISGQTLFLSSPRPSYSPAVLVDGVYTYPVGYQPDQTWESAFIAEYEYETRTAPYGLSPTTTRHNLGLPGRPLGGADDK